MCGSIVLFALATPLPVSVNHLLKYLMNNLHSASCVPDCNSNEDDRSRRSTKRELPFVSLGHELNADLPIQRKLASIDEEILIIDERSSGELGG